MVSEATWKQVEAKVAAHKGKVVVLDAWATSCPACVEEFPGLVALHKKHGDKVVCMSISCDYLGIKTKPPKFYNYLYKRNTEKRRLHVPDIH